MRLIMNLYVLVTLSCSVLLKAQIGSTSVDNFPVYQDTGNPQEDAQRYNAANKAWMAATPGAIPAMVNSQWQASIKTEIEDKKVNAEQKIATIPPNQHYTQEGTPIAAPQKTINNVALQPIQKQVIPDDYPQLIDTGNPDEDHRKLDAAKQAWIAANPAAYAKMFEGQNYQNNPAVVISNTEQKTKLTEPETVNSSPIAEQKAVMIPPYNPNQNAEQQEMPVMPITEQIPAPPQNQILPADYPKHVDTGNQQQDQQKYETAKQAWIATHTQAYENINVRTKQLIDKQEFDQMPSEKQQHILQNPDLYFIANTLYVDEQIAIVANPHQPAEKHQVTQEDISNMPAEKLEYIKKHPDVYEIVVKKKPIIQEGQIIQGQTLEKYKVTKDDLDKINPEKLIYMKAHPEVYDLTGIE